MIRRKNMRKKDGGPFKIWLWLYPATYLIHILEEYGAGEGFPQWSSRVTGTPFSTSRFLLLSGLACFLMLIGTYLAGRHRNFHWLPVTLALVLLANVITHTLGTLRTDSYSPGLVSAWVLWFPLSVYTLRLCFRKLSPKMWWWGFGAGVIVHLVVYWAPRFAG